MNIPKKPLISFQQLTNQAFLILAFSTDTAVSAVILALLVVVHKKYETSDIGALVKVEEDKKEGEVEA